MQIWKKLGLTVVFCVLSAGMTVNAGFTGSNVHSAGQSMGVGGLLEESLDPEACLEAAQNAKETRKKIYGYEKRKQRWDYHLPAHHKAFFHCLCCGLRKDKQCGEYAERCENIQQLFQDISSLSMY